MQYRYFCSTNLSEVVNQFVRYYGKENVLRAETQEEFEDICDNDDEYIAVVLDTFLFRDLLMCEENIYKIKPLESRFEYIVFVGSDIMELNEKLKKLNHKYLKV